MCLTPCGSALRESNLGQALEAVTSRQYQFVRIAPVQANGQFRLVNFLSSLTTGC